MLLIECSEGEPDAGDKAKQVMLRIQPRAIHEDLAGQDSILWADDPLEVAIVVGLELPQLRSGVSGEGSGIESQVIGVKGKLVIEL